MKISGAGLLCSLTWVLGACGSAASYNYDLPPSDNQPTLARMRGQTAGAPVGTDPSLLRIALVWFPISHGPGKVQYSQPVRHQELGLGSFELGISQEPPGRVIEEVDIKQDSPARGLANAEMMRYAQAEIVLYEDRNNNKALDVLDPGINQIDRVIGRAQGVRVWWLSDGSPAPADRRGYLPVQQGWSFTYGPIKNAPDVRDCAPGRDLGDTWKPVCNQLSPIKEPAKDVTEQTDGFVLTVSNDPKLQAYACRGFWGTSPEKLDEWLDSTPGWNAPEVRSKICNPATCNGTTAGGPLDLPVKGRNVKIECNPDKKTYRWKDCEPDPSRCGTVFCHEGKGARDPDLTKPPPAGWPQECL